ncbi:MAG: ion channel [Xanthobacteraceae bacterium]
MISNSAPPALLKVQMRRKPRPHMIRVGNRDVFARGLPDNFWSDLYYRAMTVSWPAFFAAAALIFVLLNSGFAVLYLLGDAPIANVVPAGFAGHFYFSIETLATVGYGDMHPQTSYGHIIATIEIFTGMALISVMTGLVFARFSRPRSRFVFANFPVIGTIDGRTTLMIRIANARHNAISGATAKLWLIRAEQTAEGMRLRRYHELVLQRNENPVFILTWTLFHIIDKSSPLHGLNAADLQRDEATLAVTVTGFDDRSVQNLSARRTYSYADIRWQHRYVDITSNTTDGDLLLDYDKFHDVAPE